MAGESDRADDDEMHVEPLSEAEATKRRSQPLSYAGSGCTRTVPPPGYSSFTKTRRLPESTDFDVAARALMSWQVQARAGLRVAASAVEIVEGAICVLRFGPGPFALAIPCRVIYTITEADERGFAYGTLPGHPESGEEAFVLRRNADGKLDFTITAFSLPASRLAKLGGPATRQVQRLMTTRYLRALES